MENVSFLIKPASGSCNLRCRYCFYEDEMDNRTFKSYGLMSDETLENLVKKGMEEADRQVFFAFQGGEPTLMGLDFYRRFIELVNSYKKRGLNTSFAIQTNGMLINEEWARFLHENHFLVGISMDGTKDFHDSQRVDMNKKGSWKTVVNSLRILQKYEVEVNALCVVNAQTARHPKTVYENLKKLGFHYLQFIPCLDPIGMERGNMPYSLTPKRYGEFLCELFDLWFNDWYSGQYTSVRLFDDYVHLLMGEPASACATNGRCSQYFTVEGDGSVFPCDFYVLDGYQMGNINTDSICDLTLSDAAQNFYSRACGIPDACRECPWVKICNGGCKRDWEEKGCNYYCPSFKRFFEYAMPRLQAIVREEMRAKAQG